jgi:hypothetical protein
MSLILDGTAGVTFNNSTVQASAGVVLQVVSTSKTDTFSSSSTSFTAITGLSVSITPKFATSKIFVLVSMTCGMSADYVFNTRLMRNSTAIDIGDAAGSRSPASTGGYQGSSAIIYQVIPQNITYLDSPATTSSTTYSVQVAVENGTVYVNRTANDGDASARGRFASNITVMEIAG